MSRLREHPFITAVGLFYISLFVIGTVSERLGTEQTVFNLRWSLYVGLGIIGILVLLDIGAIFRRYVTKNSG